MIIIHGIGTFMMKSLHKSTYKIYFIFLFKGWKFVSIFLVRELVINNVVRLFRREISKCCGILLWDFRKCCGIKPSVVGFL